MTAGCSIALTMRCPGWKRCEIAEEREVVGLGAAAGEDDLLLAGAERRGHLGARLLDGRARLPPQAVQLGRVAVALGEVRQHRLEHLRVDRRRGRVVEVDGLHGETASRVRSSSVMLLRAPLMALSSRRHTTRDAQDSARSQAPSSGTQPTSESGPSSAVTTSPTATSRGGPGQLVPAAHAPRRLDQAASRGAARGCARGTAPGCSPPRRSPAAGPGGRRRGRPGTPWPSGRIRSVRRCA